MNLTNTIQFAKDYLKINMHKGTKCPCCNQNVKLYKRKIGSAQSRALILMSKSKSEWVHIRDIVKKINISGDFAKLVYWGLVEEKLNEDTKKKNSGFWRLTGKGIDFVSGIVSVPSHAHVYNGKCVGYSETHITIRESIGKHFDYQELMNE